MEKTAKYNLWIILALLMSLFTNGQSINDTVIEKFETICGNTKVEHFYSIEEASIERYTISPQVMDINTNVLNLHFLSEVNDNFKIYVNKDLHSDIAVNTTFEAGGNTRLLDIEFPDGKDSFILRIESNKYGCFETEARKKHPMLYVKYFTNYWSLDHNTVFEIPQFHFLKKTRNRR